MSRLPFVLLLAAAASGCNSLFETGLVEVRVRNGSAVVMEDVRIWLSGGPVEYPTLEPGEVTAYRAVERAYRIATVEATIDGELQRLQVIDFVGEDPLRPGRYTYRLGLFEGVSLTLELVED